MLRNVFGVRLVSVELCFYHRLCIKPLEGRHATVNAQDEDVRALCECSGDVRQCQMFLLFMAAIKLPLHICL